MSHSTYKALSVALINGLALAASSKPDPVVNPIRSALNTRVKFGLARSYVWASGWAGKSCGAVRSW
jgi:hypothetical protein